jgi:hypothetical protein
MSTLLQPLHPSPSETNWSNCKLIFLRVTYRRPKCIDMTDRTGAVCRLYSHAAVWACPKPGWSVEEKTDTKRSFHSLIRDYTLGSEIAYLDSIHPTFRYMFNTCGRIAHYHWIVSVSLFLLYDVQCRTAFEIEWPLGINYTRRFTYW